MHNTLITKTFSQALSKNNLSLSNPEQEKLLCYLSMLEKWNRVFNLTSIDTPEEMIYLHLIDSLVIEPYLHGERLIDVGTGAGLPGIPLAIINPDKQWTLLDKNNKKTRFLTQVTAELKLKNVQIVHSRTEDFHPEQGFDSILSRAFSTLRSFVESTAHLLNPSGQFLAMKGRYPQTEIDDLPARFHLQKVIRLDIKGIHVERHLVCLS